MTIFTRLGRKARALCSTLGCAMLVLLVVIHFTPVTSWWAWSLAGDWTDARGDTLIVLSADIEADAVLGPSSYLRALYAVRAYRESPFRTIIVTGGRFGASPVALGDAFRDFLVGNGVPASIIRTENNARSTRENALLVRPLLQGTNGKVILMTSDFHMYRARRVFEKAGIHVTPRPIPDVLKHSRWIVNRWPSFWTLVLESAKIGYYSWKQWM